MLHVMGRYKTWTLDWTMDWIIYSVLDWVTEPTNTKTMCWEKSNWLEAEYSLASHTLCEGLIV